MKTLTRIENWLKAHLRVVDAIAITMSAVVWTLILVLFTSGPVTKGDALLAAALFLGLSMVIYGAAKLNKVLGVVLCLSLMAVPRTQAQLSGRADLRFEPAAPLIIGGIVIIIGAGLGVIGCRAIKRCNKIAAGKTNLPPEELQFAVAGGEPVYGAVFTWPEVGTCYEERLLPSTPTVFTMCPVIDGSATRTLVHADVGFQFVESWGEFQEEMAAHGLSVPDSPSISASYERGGHPCEPQQCPISFNATTHVAKVGLGGVLVTVEKSEDLLTWELLMAVEIEPWMNLRFQEASETGACFFRVTTKEGQ